jgi:two-component system cell cycle sensor histidine kinase/response regulator CckA
VVDDDPTVRGIVITALKAQGFVVDEAQDGLAALAVLKKRPGQFDIVLTDIEMPKMNGRELGIHLHEIHPELPVLYMSGFCNPLDESGVPADCFLAKPFTPAVLVNKVRRVAGIPKTSHGV